MRLLECHECKTIDELPDYSGPPEYDVLLDHVIETRHTYPSGQTHVGNLIGVEQESYLKHKDEILLEIRKGLAGGTTGFDPEFYATKNTYQEDAINCYQRHGRPSWEGCPDYRDSTKRIGNPTKQGWKRGPKVYLCSFCPYENVARQKRQKESGVI